MKEKTKVMVSKSWLDANDIVSNINQKIAEKSLKMKEKLAKFKKIWKRGGKV